MLEDRQSLAQYLTFGVNTQKDPQFANPSAGDFSSPLIASPVTRTGWN